MSEPVVPEPDVQDWTVVLTRPCSECGFDAAALDVHDIPTLVRDAVARFDAALRRPDAGERPAPAVWSPLEYGCHIRDVCRLFDERLSLMLAEDDPLFANWDQDETALQGRYWTQNAADVATELAAAGEQIAQRFTAVSPDQWQRPSRRSNGSVFTVDSFGRYFIHDLVHHLHDVAA
jgi:hypothetical protein